MAAFTIAALRSELQNDPGSLGYAPFINQASQSIADILNFGRDGSTPCPVNGVVGTAVSVKRSDISPKEIVESIDVADFPALPASPSNAQLSSERRFLAWLTGLSGINANVRLLNDDGSDGPVVANLKAMFPASGTRTRLLAIASRVGSRAESLWGAGTSISADQVQQAWNF